MAGKKFLLDEIILLFAVIHGDLAKKNLKITTNLVFMSIANLSVYANILYRVRQIPFILENASKKTTKYFLKFLFLFESIILPVNNGK